MLRQFSQKRMSARRSVLNAVAPMIQGLESRLMMSISASQLTGPFQTVGNHWTYDEVSTAAAPATITGSLNETISKQTTDPDNNLTAFELDATLFDGSGTNEGTSVTYYGPLATGNGVASYGDTTTFASGTISKTTYSPNSIILPGTLTQGVAFGADNTFTETDVQTPAGGVAGTPDVESVTVSGMLVSETPGPITTPLGVSYPTTFEVDITTTDTPVPNGVAGTPDTQREWFAPGKGLVLEEDSDTTDHTALELESFDGAGAQGGTNKLDLITVPSTASTTAALSPIVVHVETSAGTLISSDTSDVTLAIASPDGGVLGGTTTVAAVNGVATFSNITITTAGNYTLAVTDGALTGATSGEIVVSASGGGGGGGGGGGSTGITPAILTDTVPPAVIAGPGVKLHGAIKSTLTNSLGTDEKGYTVNVYASLDGTLDTSVDTLVTTVVKPSTIKAGKTVPVSIPITSLPATLPAGTYFLITETVDGTGNIGTATSTSTVTVAAPFVAFSEVVTPVAPVVGLVSDSAVKGNVNATLLITNNGNVASKGITPINITASTTAGVAGTSIATLSKNLNVLPGKTVKVIVPIKNLPALPNGSYFFVAEVTDTATPADTTTASSASTVPIALGFVSLAATLGPGNNIKAGDTLTLTNNGNVADIGSFTATIGFALDYQGAQPAPGSASAAKTFHILPGKSVKVHSNDWSKLTGGLETGVPYFLTVRVTDSKGNSAFAVSTTAFTL